MLHAETLLHGPSNMQVLTPAMASLTAAPCTCELMGAGLVQGHVNEETRVH